jgi:hypothetical protein
MALLDLVVDANFRSEQVGRVVIFPGGRRNRGYLVKSESEELRIRAFLKMFYLGQSSIQLLGLLLALEWSRELSYAFGRQSALLFRVGITLACYALVVGAPYWLLWRSYKRSILSFVSVQDEVAVSGTSAGRWRWVFGVVWIAIATLAFVGILALTRGTSVIK